MTLNQATAYLERRQAIPENGCPQLPFVKLGKSRRVTCQNLGDLVRRCRVNSGASEPSHN